MTRGTTCVPFLCLQGAAFCVYTLAVVEVMISKGQVRLELTSWDRLWALKSNLTSPIQGVLNVYADPTATRPKGFRLPGTSVPGLIQAGTFIGKRGNFGVFITRVKVSFSSLKTSPTPASSSMFETRKPSCSGFVRRVGDV